MLNIINNIGDEHTLCLKASEDGDKRRIDLFISYDNILTVIGYENNRLVWFSRTVATDILSSRRVFESMRWSEFYRSVSFADALASVDLTPDDLVRMWHAQLDNLETDSVLFSGRGAVQKFIQSGIDFANFVSHLLKTLRSKLSQFGSDDDILSDIEHDLKIIDDAYRKNEHTCSDEAMELTAKWLDSDFIKISARGSVREAYQEICSISKKLIKRELMKGIQ